MQASSLFETKAASEEYNKTAASWVKKALAKFFPTPPQIIAGEVRINKTA